MQNTEVQPLVVTPFPRHGESLMGFILRTSEMNGYETPTSMLTHAGMNNNEMRSIRPPLEKLAKLYNREIPDFTLVSYGRSEKSKYNKKYLAKKVKLPFCYLNIKSPKICPECILDNGIIESYWDEKNAIACAMHARKAISICPNCNKNLSWFRKGLLRCQCGQDLSKLRGDVVEDKNVIALLDVVRSKFQGTPLNESLLVKCGFPIKDLASMSLPTLLGIINRLQPGKKRKTDFKVPKGVSNSFHAFKLASGIFSRWPTGFYDYLESLHEGIEKPIGSTLQKQFHKFCISFFKYGLPEGEMVFLRKAFISFGNERWRTNGYIDTRFLNSVDAHSNIVGIYGLAEALGIKAPTAMKYVKKGLITGESVETAKGKRMLYDLSKIPFKRSEGKYHKLREAGKFLGLPISLLGFLRKEKIYTLKRLGFGLDGYSELDLIEFRVSLMSKSPKLVEFDLNEHISLEKIMFKKLLGNEIKGTFIQSILSNKILPVGHQGSELKNLIFNRNEVMVLLNSIQTI